MRKICHHATRKRAIDRIQLKDIFQAKCIGANTIGVKIDKFGVVPDSLLEELKKAEHRSVPPKFILLVPTGSNPTGGTATLERKKEIYKVLL